MGNSKIQTVLGEISPAELGPTLIHEHVLVDFIGAKSYSRERWSTDDAEQVMLPYLLEVKAQGFTGFCECTPHYIGRDAELLRRLSQKSGLHILTNTGLYAAGQRDGEPEPYLPAYSYQLSPEALAGSWIREWYEGIDGTGIRPGFIKIGVNPGPMRQISETVVRAAAIASRYSGLSVACHTGRGLSALRCLDIFDEEKVAPGKFLFVHAQSEKDKKLQLECARRGCWMEYDGVGPDSAAWHLELIMELLDAGFEDRLLISQDAGWYRPGEVGGGKVRGFDFLKKSFVPMLSEAGLSQSTIDHFLIHNPARALSIWTS